MRMLALIALIGWSCSTIDTHERVELYYDSLAQALFLSPRVGMTVTSNVDSFKIEFFDSSDFNLMIETRRLCQAIYDSTAMKFKTRRYDIKEFAELEIDKHILGFDTLLYPLLAEKYLKRKNKKSFDSLTAKIGLTPATIIEFHSRVARYFRIINQKNVYTDNKNNLVITYYVSELTQVPYPKTLYRIFVNNKNEILESGKHEDYDKP
jgi:hypothetical protein